MAIFLERAIEIRDDFIHFSKSTHGAAFYLLIFSFCLRVSLINWGMPSNLANMEATLHGDEAKVFLYVDTFPKYFLEGRSDFYIYPNSLKNIVGIVYKTLNAAKWSFYHMTGFYLPHILETSVYLIRFLSVLMGTLSIFLVYRILAMTTVPAIGILGILFMNFPHMHVSNAALCTPDVFSSFCITFSFYLFWLIQKRLEERKPFNLTLYLFLCLIVGWSFGVRFTNILAAVFLPLPIIKSYWDKQLGFSSALTYSLLGVLTLFIGVIIFFPAIYADTNAFIKGFQHLIDYHGIHGKSLTFDQLFLNSWVPIARGLTWPLTIFAIISVPVVAWKRFSLLWLAPIFLLTMHYYKHLQSFIDRYSIQVTPLLVIIICLAFFEFGKYLKNRFPKFNFRLLFIPVLLYALTSILIPYNFFTNSTYNQVSSFLKSLPEGTTVGVERVANYHLKNAHARIYAAFITPPENIKSIDAIDSPTYLVVSDTIKRIAIEQHKGIDSGEANPILPQEVLDFYKSIFIDKNSRYELLKEFRQPKNPYILGRSAGGEPTQIYKLTN